MLLRMLRRACALLLVMPLFVGMKPLDPANRLEEGQMPTPYSAAEIQTACAPGTVLTYRVEQAGKEPYLQITKFVEGAQGAAAFESWTANLAGEPHAAPQKVDTEWAALQRHAAFRETGCTLTEEKVEVPAGTHTCWVYTLAQDGGKATRFDFAQDLPGPPVRMTVNKDGATVYRMELLSRVRQTSSTP
jgi:hypothetical protein